MRKWMANYLSHPKNYSLQLSRQKKCRNEDKLKVLVHYGGNPPKCACCGENHIEFLTIDHIECEGTKHLASINRAGSSFYRWLIGHDFPEGFQVLCANCNQAKGKNKKRFCPVHHPELYQKETLL